jgi:hypothetical protein
MNRTTPRTLTEAYGRPVRLYDVDAERQERFWRRCACALAALTLTLLIAHLWRLS